MTYAQFLVLFLVLPLAILVLVLRRRLFDRRFLGFTAALLGIALVYMAPWDHTAAVWGIWTWTRGLTFGIRWWNVPPEEYTFCLLEALLAATLTYALLYAHRPGTRAEDGTESPNNAAPHDASLPPARPEREVRS